MPVTLVMLEAIRDFYYKTGKRIAMKPAGGISKSKLALHYLVMLNEVLGEEWMNNHWFRFGASSLANDISDATDETKNRRVSVNADYFSLD
jgi:deoxyribose-phosphate aldolase